jgi:hypothetical protein
LEESKKETAVVFLFGAGASVDAGIPDTFKFVVDFEEHIKKNHGELSEQLSAILKVIGKFQGKKSATKSKRVDVEQLLYILRRLIERNSDPLLEFYENRKCEIDIDEKTLGLLKTLLEDYIRERVIIEDETRLDYLKELLTFDKPVEIFSTNYDTCIEQLSHANHMRYTDGFDIYWSPENFDKEFDVKHYKMHGSVIWYEDVKTKECVKIPVHGFVEGKPVALRLIYGEDVKPLLIYPAQKAEYIEPLTNLQLKFKERLFSKKTRFVIVVGYSFRDNYIIHMLWDAARVNEDLHVIIVAPNAQEIFENKLKFINREKNDLSRIHDRVICLPYPFSTIIYSLRNFYLSNLGTILMTFKNLLEIERTGQEPNWHYLVRPCIEAEFLTKAETAFQNAKKKWEDLDLGTPNQRLLLEFKALLHSIICKDGGELEWLSRVNDSLRNFSIENICIHNDKGGLVQLGLKLDGTQFEIRKFQNDWISPLVSEKRKKVELLTPKFKNALNRIDMSLDKLEAFYEYLGRLTKGVRLDDYTELESDSPEVKHCFQQLENAKKRGSWNGNKGEPNSIILGIEKGRLRSFLGADSFQLNIM